MTKSHEHDFQEWRSGMVKCAGCPTVAFEKDLPESGHTLRVVGYDETVCPHKFLTQAENDPPECQCCGTEIDTDERNHQQPSAPGALRALAKNLVWLLNPGNDAQYYSPFAGDTGPSLDSFHKRLMESPDYRSLHLAIFDVDTSVPDNWDELRSEPEDWEAINAYHRRAWQDVFDAKVEWVRQRIESALSPVPAGEAKKWNAIIRVTGCGEHEEWVRTCDGCWDAVVSNSDELIDMAADELNESDLAAPNTEEAGC